MGVPLCPTEYDDYDPNDIPEDQAAPEVLPVYTEAPTEDYDDYDPNDIPEDQAKPEDSTEPDQELLTVDLDQAEMEF